MKRYLRLCFVLISLAGVRPVEAAWSLRDCPDRFRALVHGLSGNPTPSRATLATRAFQLGPEMGRLMFSDLTNPKLLLKAPGYGHIEAHDAQLMGQRVFVKVSPVTITESVGGTRELKHFRNEVAWVKRLSEAGVGPKYYGVTEKDGHYVLVTEFVEGLHFSPSSRTHPGEGAITRVSDLQASRALVDSFKKIRSFLKKEGIAARDLQFRVTKDRAYVIDPEMFRPAEKQFEDENLDLDATIEYLETKLR